MTIVVVCEVPKNGNNVYFIQCGSHSARAELALSYGGVDEWTDDEYTKECDAWAAGWL